MRAFGFSGLTAALVIGLAGPAFAQGEGARVGLADVILLARDNSLAAQASRQNVQGAQAERQATVSNALPNLSLQTAFNYNELPGGSGLAALFGGGNGGGLVGFPAQGTTVDTTLSGNVVLFDAFATRDAIAIADYTIQARQLALLQAEQDAMANAAVAYFQVLRAEGLAAVAADNVKQSQEQMRLGELKLRAGTGTRADVLQLRAQLANAQGAFTQARNAVDIARLQLSNAVNAPVADRALDTQPAVPAVDVDMAKDVLAALDRRPEIGQQEARLAIDETRVSLESRALWPNVQANSRYAQRGLNQGQFTAGVAVNWAIFDGFKTRNRMEVARAQAQAGQTQIEQTRQNIALEIRQQFQNREEAKSRINTAREGLEAAQEAYRLAVRRFEVGLSTPFETTSVQNTLVQSGNNYVTAVNDLRVAEIRLARALGYDLAVFVTGRITTRP
ncbi:MAG: TolC family protein [Candidatus Sericytochromatia bacterium]